MYVITKIFEVFPKISLFLLEMNEKKHVIGKKSIILFKKSHFIKYLSYFPHIQ